MGNAFIKVLSFVFRSDSNLYSAWIISRFLIWIHYCLH